MQIYKNQPIGIDQGEEMLFFDFSEGRRYVDGPWPAQTGP